MALLDFQIKAEITPGTNFAGVDYVSNVKTAAAHKDVLVTKHVSANVQLFGTINDARNVYAAAVKRTATKLAGNNAPAEQTAAIDNFTAEHTWFEHDEDCYSIVRNKGNGRPYLYAIYNGATSEYRIDGVLASKADVIALLTPSAAKAMQNSGTTINKRTGIEHAVTVRTIALDSITEVRINKKVLPG